MRFLRIDEGLKIVEKGKRKGQELSWEQLVRGDVVLGQQLEDSVALASEADSGDESPADDDGAER